MKSSRYKLIKLFIVFIVIPISFTIEYSPILKLIIGVLGVIYILFVIFKVEKISLKIKENINWKTFWKRTFLKFIFIATATSLFVWGTNKENLFGVMIHKPTIWILILFFYSFFSVYPQEILYRTFFFKRYENLFKNKLLFIILNAIIFSLGHLFFKNSLVIFMTFIGGILFAFTYKKTKSTLLFSIEHAIYGCWLFTVGMVNMLGFPS